MKISVIGCGNMAGAIMGGMIKNGLVSPEEVTASDVFEPARQRVRNNLRINTVSDNADPTDCRECKSRCQSHLPAGI